MRVTISDRLTMKSHTKSDAGGGGNAIVTRINILGGRWALSFEQSLN